MSVMTICLDVCYISRRPWANEHSFGHFTRRSTYVLLLPST